MRTIYLYSTRLGRKTKTKCLGKTDMWNQRWSLIAQFNKFKRISSWTKPYLKDNPIFRSKASWWNEFLCINKFHQRSFPKTNHILTVVQKHPCLQPALFEKNSKPYRSWKQIQWKYFRPRTMEGRRRRNCHSSKVT